MNCELCSLCHFMDSLATIWVYRRPIWVIAYYGLFINTFIMFKISLGYIQIWLSSCHDMCVEVVWSCAESGHRGCGRVGEADRWRNRLLFCSGIPHCDREASTSTTDPSHIRLSTIPHLSDAHTHAFKCAIRSAEWTHRYAPMQILLSVVVLHFRRVRQKWRHIFRDLYLNSYV